MLSKLSSALKKGFNKIAGAMFLDKKTIEIIVKDLQRALIQADVNVHLAKKIGDKIKKEAENEKIKGIEKKEHLTKILHDEILILLGKEKYEIKLNKKKQTKIILLGLYGAGKCVHGDSNIILSNGSIISAKKLYNSYNKKLKEQYLEDGKIIDISNENLFVPSFNPKTLKIENKKATHLWELKKKNLIQINLDKGNDYSVKVTPEHPFFILRNGQVIKIRADELTEQDYVAIPNKINIKGNLINLFKKIKKLDLQVYLTNEEIEKIISKKNKTIKEIANNLKNKRNYCQLTVDLKKGIIPIKLIQNKLDANFLKIKAHHSKKIITTPTYLTKEFAEFLGYLVGDGHIEKNYAEIITQDKEIIQRISKLSKILFNIIPLIKKDNRTKNIYRIILASKTLVEILKIFNLNPGKKGKNLQIPSQIILSDNEIVRTFIKAYFDCDSSPSFNRRQIELTSESKILIQQINYLLKRFKIDSTISKKIIQKIPYWRLIIKSKSAEAYADKIGYLIQKKQKRVNLYKKFGIIQGSGKEDMIPVGKILKELRISLGFSIGEIQSNAVYSYGIYEKKGLISREKLLKLFYYYNEKKKGIFCKVLKDFLENNYKNNHSKSTLNSLIHHLKKENLIYVCDGIVNLNEKGKQILKQYQKFKSKGFISSLYALANSNVNWSRVQKITPLINNEDYVYDLTVENNHSFIADGFIVHNTTSTAKLAAYYSKRGFKTAMIGLDVHRPAAADQLEQLGKQTKIQTFTNKNEKNALKIYNQYKEQLKAYDLIIIDTAGRHSLNKNLITEIKTLNKEIKPDYTILTIQADIGQAAKQQASEFQKACNINGVIITRMDSTAKAGGALTACAETNAPVYFIGTGEKINELETFNPKSFISRLLGLGDLEGLLEKVQSAVDEKSQKKLKKKLEKGEFNLRDLQSQLKQMKGMGSLSKIAEMIPGLGKAKIPENLLGTQEDKISAWNHAINSMTEQEINHPEILEKQTSRLSRIAKGSGTTTTDIRQLLKQYKLLKEMTQGGMSEIDPSQGLNQKQIMKLAKKFGKKIRI